MCSSTETGRCEVLVIRVIIYVSVMKVQSIGIKEKNG